MMYLEKVKRLAIRFVLYWVFGLAAVVFAAAQAEEQSTSALRASAVILPRTNASDSTIRIAFFFTQSGTDDSQWSVPKVSPPCDLILRWDGQAQPLPRRTAQPSDFLPASGSLAELRPLLKTHESKIIRYRLQGGTSLEVGKEFSPAQHFDLPSAGSGELELRFMLYRIAPNATQAHRVMAPPIRLRIDAAGGLRRMEATFAEMASKSDRATWSSFWIALVIAGAAAACGAAWLWRRRG